MCSSDKVVAQVSENLFIAAILNQLTVQISYQPLQCQMVAVNPKPADPLMYVMMMPESCFVIDNTVTSLCKPAADGRCMLLNNFDNVIPVPEQHLRITGTISTTNIIMAIWSTRKCGKAF
ncbi:hypothetical protein KIN20_023456 [Parelaphostrongylus tenuis]|uniref:Uncharacterized protein n=1 Tax=Parelaphostrongylus tenuis TaxID=148309 RepID=A0AAD5MWX1_PARTN|nr:hypothetical protein KIN20_023456 [Parelaphostrongylus tenuis]